MRQAERMTVERLGTRVGIEEGEQITAGPIRDGGTVWRKSPGKRDWRTSTTFLDAPDS